MRCIVLTIQDSQSHRYRVFAYIFRMQVNGGDFIKMVELREAAERRNRYILGNAEFVLHAVSDEIRRQNIVLKNQSGILVNGAISNFFKEKR